MASRSTDTPNGWFAGAKKVNTPNFTRGRASQVVLASTQHVTAGPKGREFQSCIEWFGNPAAEASAHFAVDKDGTVVQFVSIYDTAWANGLQWLTVPRAGAQWTGVGWYNARGKKVSPLWPLLKVPTNPNLTTISVEHAGQPNEAWTEPMFDSTVHILRWIGATLGVAWTPRKTLIGHFELDTVDKRNCPGPNVDWDRLAVAASPVARVKAKATGAIAQQEYKAEGKAAKYFGPDVEIAVTGGWYKNGYYHAADDSGFIPAGQVEPV